MYEFIEPDCDARDVEIVDVNQFGYLKLTQGKEIEGDFPLIDLRVPKGFDIPNFFFCGVLLIVSKRFVDAIEDKNVNGKIYPVNVEDEDNNKQGEYYYLHLYRGEKGVDCFDFEKSDYTKEGFFMTIDVAEIDQTKIPNDIDLARVDGVKLFLVIASEQFKERILSLGIEGVKFSSNLRRW